MKKPTNMPKQIGDITDALFSKIMDIHSKSTARRVFTQKVKPEFLNTIATAIWGAIEHTSGHAERYTPAHWVIYKEQLIKNLTALGFWKEQNDR